MEGDRGAGNPSETGTSGTTINPGDPAIPGGFYSLFAAETGSQNFNVAAPGTTPAPRTSTSRRTTPYGPTSPDPSHRTITTRSGQVGKVNGG